MQQYEISEVNNFDESDQPGGESSEESDENLLKNEIIDFS
jgi:hypothetical protein